MKDISILKDVVADVVVAICNKHKALILVSMKIRSVDHLPSQVSGESIVKY